ncbi:hypothetical protein BGW80DRAFT_1559769 [Lactifluus volemus]|nr:hypothetical protein BGW80DRAFT_1559769 [Lactifluus volemus]
MISIFKLDADDNEYSIKSVTVFKSNKAEILRVFNISLEGGQSKVQIRHLSGSIDTESCRVTGLGDAQLFDVVCSVGRYIEEVDPESTAEAIRKLKIKKDTLSRELDALDEMLNTMTTGTYSKSLTAEHEEEIFGLTREIDALSSTQVKKQGKAIGEVTVVITEKPATDIKLRLTYLVRNATWTPAYELHATTEAGIPAPSVSLHYRSRTIPVLGPTKISLRPPKSLFGEGANMSAQQHAPPIRFGQRQEVAQLSGMSAIQPRRRAAPPPLTSQLAGDIPAMAVQQYAPPIPFGQEQDVRVAPPAPPPPLTSPLAGDIPAAAVEEREHVDEKVDVTIQELTPIWEPSSVVNERPLALTYHVEGTSERRCTTPSIRRRAPVRDKDTTRDRVQGATCGVPRGEREEHERLPTAIAGGDIAPGDMFSCTLGADPATCIRYSRTSKRAEEDTRTRAIAFSEQWTATTYRSRTTVSNRHPFPVRALVLRDGVPMTNAST